MKFIFIVFLILASSLAWAGAFGRHYYFCHEYVSKDTDGDGTIDLCDGCPFDGGPDWNKGCPAPSIWFDCDNDGVTNNQDRCVTEFGYLDNQGCPTGY